MDAAFLDNYIVLTIVGICVCIGYVIKTSLDFIPNKYIPLIMLVIGTVANVLFHFPDITLQVVLAGMVSGLASTGSYEAVHQFIKNSGNHLGAEFLEGADEEEKEDGKEDDESASS